MATMTVQVSSRLKVSPYIISEGDDPNSGTFKTIRVPVPIGVSSLYIQEIYTEGAIGGSSQTYTINVTTDITLTLEGVINVGDPSQNTIFDSAYLFVSLDASSEPFYSTGITRTHTGFAL